MIGRPPGRPITRFLVKKEVGRMAKEFMHKTLKELFPDYIVLIKIGTFYEAYGDDANILSFFFSYKTRTIGENISCGFPINSLNRIISIYYLKLQ